MTDRELLELAAKAAGIELRWDSAYGENPLYQKWKYIDNDWTEWNPLEDDGDALRLAVKINWVPSRVEVLKLSISECPYAATRRAIVRAAAEIGKEME